MNIIIDLNILLNIPSNISNFVYINVSFKLKQWIILYTISSIVMYVNICKFHSYIDSYIFSLFCSELEIPVTIIISILYITIYELYSVHTLSSFYDDQPILAYC